MTQKHPLCLYNGDIKELQASDSLVDHEVFNVKDYGAVGDGTTPDSVAIQAAIDAAISSSKYGIVVFFPVGIYKVTTTINITGTITILGESPLGSIIKSFAAYNDTTPTINISTNVNILNIYITSNVLRISAVAINCSAPVTVLFDNISIFRHMTGIRFNGILSSKLSNISIFYAKNNTTDITNFTPDPDRGLLEFFATGSDKIWTTNISNLHIGGSELSDYCILITKADGLQFANGYIGFARIADVCMKPAVSTDSILAVSFTGFYFDGSTLSSTELKTLLIPVVSGLTGNIADCKFIGCNFGSVDYSVYITNPNLVDIYFTGCRFFDTKKNAFYVDGPIAGSNNIIYIDVCYFYHCGESATSYDFLSLFPTTPTTSHWANISITNSFFATATTNKGISILSKIQTLLISNNSFDGFTAGYEINDISSTTHKTFTGNISNNVTATAITSKFPGIVDAKTGFIVNGTAATNGNILKGDGTAFVSAAPGTLSAGSATKITITVSGGSNCLLSSASISASLTGIVDVANGGTGVSSWTSGNKILKANSTTISESSISDSGVITTINASSGLSITATTVSSTTATGALVVAGGVGIGGALNVGQNINLTTSYGIYANTKLMLGFVSSNYYLANATAGPVVIAYGCTTLSIGQSATGDISIGTSLPTTKKIKLGQSAADTNPVQIKVGDALRTVGTAVISGYTCFVVV